MNKLLDAERLKNEDVTEELKIPAVSEEKAEESVVVNIDGSVNDEAPVEPVVENPAVQDVVETPVEVFSPPDILPKDEIPGETDGKPDNAETNEPDKFNAVEFEQLDKTQLLEHLEKAVQQEITPAVKDKIDALKQAFYRLKRIETDKAQKDFVANGGLPGNFEVEADADEEKLKKLLVVFREKKAALAAQIEKLREENLLQKKAIIEQLKKLIESQDDFHKIYPEFRKLQQQWKEIKQVPQAMVNELWKEYQYLSEKFYDLMKINNELRDYDFKKNLELKQELINAVEKLHSKKDIVAAFYQLQYFHQEWREIGPVAKELREEIWLRFKEASAVINKKHQEHFEAVRAIEQRNLEEKTAICEEIEAVDFYSFTKADQWNEQHQRITTLQDKWKSVGFAPRKSNDKIYERFKNACNAFFTAKAAFYGEMRGEQEANLKKKKTLCERVEALKDSQDWNSITPKIVALQKEWKTIGFVPKKYSDTIWKRFSGACDYFFEQKKLHLHAQREDESENLKKKQEIIKKITEFDANLPADEVIPKLREFISEWNEVGFVPYQEKDRMYKEFRQEIDKHFDRLKVDQSERRLQSFKSSLDELTANNLSNKLLSEREKLMSTYDRLKNDIQVYENNMGFLSVSSKGGGGLVKEMNRKIDSLKEELELIVKKIEAIDKNLE